MVHQGIAVGMATDIPSHNINEVIDATVFILLENPKSELKDLTKIIKGPDFSNEAPIIASSERTFRRDLFNWKGRF